MNGNRGGLSNFRYGTREGYLTKIGSKLPNYNKSKTYRAIRFLMVTQFCPAKIKLIGGLNQ